MLHILWYIIIGFIVGLLARFFFPGAVPMGFIMTVVVGIVGSIIGGLIARLFNRPRPGTPFHPAGILLSILGAVILIWVLRYTGIGGV
jgi:uncharacterized membrane protein YeaQ/YmgE (transglycosylase-associated protein family)